MLAGAAGGGGALAAASVPDPNGVIHACVDVTHNGTVTTPDLSHGPNVTIIDPGAGQRCIPPDGTVPNQQEITWNQTGPQGPVGAPGAPGSAGATGSAGKSATYTVQLPSPILRSTSRVLGEVTLGSGGGALSFPLLAYTSVTSATGTGGGSARKVHVHDLIITKKLDKASPKLLSYVLTGKHFATATVVVREAGGVKGSKRSYLRIGLKDVVISSLDNQQAVSAKSDTPVERVTFGYGAMKATYKPQN